jgi:hypothetical protein
LIETTLAAFKSNNLAALEEISTFALENNFLDKKIHDRIIVALFEAKQHEKVTQTFQKLSAAGVKISGHQAASVLLSMIKLKQCVIYTV